MCLHVTPIIASLLFQMGDWKVERAIHYISLLRALLSQDYRTFLKHPVLNWEHMHQQQIINFTSLMIRFRALKILEIQLASS